MTGRKRHYLVDTEGHLLVAGVGPADEDDREGARWLLAARDRRWPDLRLVWADQHYTGDLEEEAQEEYGICLEIVRKAAGQRGFVVLPRRWVVERSIAWLGRCRRLSKDYERDPAASESWCYLASIQLLLNRLCPRPRAERPYLRKAA